MIRPMATVKQDMGYRQISIISKDPKAHEAFERYGKRHNWEVKRVSTDRTVVSGCSPDFAETILDTNGFETKEEKKPQPTHKRPSNEEVYRGIMDDFQ